MAQETLTRLLGPFFWLLLVLIGQLLLVVMIPGLVAAGECKRVLVT
jgi:flagellar biosynthesis protein FliQ